MLDRSIPKYNMIMRCDEYQASPLSLPGGYTVSGYREGFEKDWGRLEYSIGDFDTCEAAEKYFSDTFLKDPHFSPERARFVIAPNGEVVGSCIAWYGMRNGKEVDLLHWLVVSDKHRSLGLGRALCCDVLSYFHKSGGDPIYLHTQPWSYTAVFLYISLGFKLCKTDTFGKYQNEYDKAANTLSRVLSKEDLAIILENTID